MSDFLVRLEKDDAGGRYVIERDGAEAELTFRAASPQLMIAEHTGVADGLRHQGAGLALVARLVQDARRDGFRIRPVCPFVRAQARRHPDWADVFQA